MQDPAAALLTQAARAEGIGSCLALLTADRFVQEINRLGPTGTNALHIAVWRNNLTLVEALLEAGASPDTTDKESGWSSLHRALYFGHLRIAAALLTSNASLALSDWRGRSPLDLLSQELKCYLASGPGDVYSWGAGTNYALGTGSTEPQVAPARVDALHGKHVVSLSAAKFHSAAVTEDGQLYTWGFGRGGRLGHPGLHLHSGESAVISPRLVIGLGRRQVVAVAAAKHHTLLCTSAGEVWAMGSNRHGQLGLSASDTVPEPRRVGALRARVIAVAAASKHSVAVTAAGEIYTWGSNALGQLGYGTFDSGSSTAPRLVDALKGRVVVAAAAAKRHTLALTADGDVFTWGHRGVSPRRVQLAGARDGKPLRFHRGHADVVRPEAVAVCAGAAHSSALTATGVVLTWRSADPALVVQEIGGGLAGKRVVSIAAGKYRTAVVTDEGDVYSWEGRSDFFPAEERRSGSGSKKITPTGRTPTNKGRAIPIAGSSPDGRTGPTALAQHLCGSVGAEGGSVGSWGSSSRPRPGSFLEKVYAQKARDLGTNLSGGAGTAIGVGAGTTSLSARPDTPRSAMRGTDSFASIIPEKLSGLKRAGCVAVGEKHSLALQRWSACQLEGLPSPPWLETSETNFSGLPSECEDEHNSGEYEDEDEVEVERESSLGNLLHLSSPQRTGVAAAATAAAATGPPTLQQLCEESVGRALVDPRTVLQVLEYADLAGASVLRAYCIAVAVCNLDAVLVEARGAFEDLQPHLLAEIERVYKAQMRDNAFGGGRGTAGGKLSGGRSAGAAAVSSAAANLRRALDLDAALGADEHGPAGNQGHLGDSMLVQPVRGPRRRLQPGLRPTAARTVLGDLDSARDGASDDDALVSCSGAFSPTLRREECSFKDLDTAAAEAAEQRLRRTLGKKIQQIEHLEARISEGATLDPQQWAKVAQRPVVASALAALDAGTAPEEVQAMLQAAAAAVAEQAIAGPSGTSPPVGSKGKADKEGLDKESAAFGGDASKTLDGGAKSAGKSRPRRRQTERSVLSAEDSTATMPDSSLATTSLHAELSSSLTGGGGVVSPGSASGGVHNLPMPVVGFATSPAGAAGSFSKPASKTIGRSVEKPPRKGALSMFLRGELDKPANGSTGGAASSSQDAVSKGPAWGGTKPSGPPSNTSLKELLSQQVPPPSKAPPLGPPKPRTPQDGNSGSGSAAKPPAGSSAMRMPLASFLNPTAPCNMPDNNKSPAWGGVSGASPPTQHKPSLKQIQEDQERRKAAVMPLGPSLRGASPPSASKPPLPGSSASWVNRGTSGLSLLGSSPSSSTASVLLGTSPSGRAFFAAPAPQSKWYVPEDDEHEQRRMKSLTAIQTEESAMKELARKYGDGNVRIQKDVATTTATAHVGAARNKNKAASNPRNGSTTKPVSAPKGGPGKGSEKSRRGAGGEAGKGVRDEAQKGAGGEARKGSGGEGRKRRNKPANKGSPVTVAAAPNQG